MEIRIRKKFNISILFWIFIGNTKVKQDNYLVLFRIENKPSILHNKISGLFLTLNKTL